MLPIVSKKVKIASNATHIYLYKVSNGNTTTFGEICLELVITLELRQLRCSIVF